MCLSEFSRMLISSPGITIFLRICPVGLQIPCECHEKMVWAFTKCLLERHFFTMAVLNFLLILRILEFSFISQLQSNQKKSVILFLVLTFIKWKTRSTLLFCTVVCVFSYLEHVHAELYKQIKSTDLYPFTKKSSKKI